MHHEKLDRTLGEKKSSNCSHFLELMNALFKLILISQETKGMNIKKTGQEHVALLEPAHCLNYEIAG